LLEKHAEPIETIKVFDRSRENKILFKTILKMKNLVTLLKIKNLVKY